MTYADKVTLVTGGSRGIGEGCVRVFAAAGATLVFCARGEKEGKALEAEVNKKGPGAAAFLKADVSKVDQIQRVQNRAHGAINQDCRPRDVAHTFQYASVRSNDNFLLVHQLVHDQCHRIRPGRDDNA